MDCIATTPGLYPLPDHAKERLADLKGHQKADLVSGDEDEEIVAVYDEVREELIEIQQDVGLDRIVEGQARWDDMLAHPLCVHENVDTGGIVRYYDNNNFYRNPVVSGELTFDGDMAEDLQAAATLTDDLQAVAPGPYSLSDLATNEHYNDESAFLDAVAEFLAGEIAAFPEEVETLFLLEPSLVTNVPADGVDEQASDAIDAVADAIDAEVIVQTYWGALDEKVHAHLLDADIDAVGYDLVTAHEESLHLVAEYGTKESVALGLVDGQNTLVEDPETVRDRVEWFCETTPETQTFDKVYATSNTGLFYLPVNRFQEKLASLAEGASLVGTEEVEA